MREGLVTVIGKQPDMAVIAEAATGHEGIEQFRTHRPDVTLMDLRLPDMSGVDTTIAIRSEFPDARIVALTTFGGDVDIQRAFAAGAKAYVLKSMPPKDLIEIIRHVHAGKKRVPPEVAALLAEHIAEESLTARERAVLMQVAGGHRNREIARLLADLRRHGQDAPQAHHRQARGPGPDRSGGHRRAPRHHPALVNFLSRPAGLKRRPYHPIERCPDRSPG